jgi:LmbE family N-acetylglucosaminyl deacetylase
MKWLFLCAHPDDLEFFCGFLMAFLGDKSPDPSVHTRFLGKKMHHQITIASMTRGEMSHFTNQVKSTKKAATVRTQELSNSCYQLGVNSPIFLGFFDGFIRVSDFAIEKLRKFLIQESPDIVVAPEPVYTYYFHPDHVRTGKIAFYTILRMIKGCHNQTTTSKIPSLYFYGGLFNHFYFPQIPTYTSQVQAALASHASQGILLTDTSLPNKIMCRINGRKTPPYPFAHALRRQYLPGKDNPKMRHHLLRGMSFGRRILMMIARSAIKPPNYTNRMRFLDGTLPPSL